VSETRAAREAEFQAALEHFSLVLIWLERGSPRPLCIDGHEYHRRQSR
jgi:hypothetical protein